MYISHVVLEDLKGFRSLNFEFRRDTGEPFAGWTVFTGDNGSGKTALLKAVAIALLGPDVARVLQPSWRGWIREGGVRAEVGVQIVPAESDKFVKGRRPEHPFWSDVVLARNGGPEVSLKPSAKRRHRGRTPHNGPWADNAAGWFCAGYGPFRRLYGASTEAQRIMSGPSRVARFATMFKEDATLGECELWLKELKHRSLEQPGRAESLLADVSRLLNDDFLRNGLRIDRVDSEGLWLRDEKGTVLPLADMSEGYRAALALMVDLLRHFAHVYDDRPLVSLDGEHVFVPHAGVVLIDEIDAHLHPAWQREIGFWLKRRFPKVQFIVTTHSPLICQAADANGIFHLPSAGSDAQPFRLSDEDYRHLVNAKADTILLSPAFGLTHTRSPKAVEDRQEAARLRAKKRTSKLSAEEERQLSLLDPLIEREDNGE